MINYMDPELFLFMWFHMIFIWCGWLVYWIANLSTSLFLFNNATDPFLTSFDNILRSKNAGIVRACADDIGITLSRLKHLLLIYVIYYDCKSFGGLALKPIKCVLVPLCRFTHEVQTSISNWIAKHIPQWHPFKIKPTAKLLRFYIGPAAGTKMWEGPIAKYNDRILELQRCISYTSDAANE